MFTRFVLVAALVGALFTLLISPTFALSESDQDAAITSLQSAVAALQSRNASQQNTINSQQTTIAAQIAQVNTLRGLLSSFSKKTDTMRTDGKKGTELYITGMNLHIVNGLGTTSGAFPTSTAVQVNGLGNVIIGYNATAGNGYDTRIGSHNLVLGDRNNYASFGGIVSGANNQINAPYASITGGYDNIAYGLYSSVSGGENNFIVGDDAIISGGGFNRANGSVASVTGGISNVANRDYSVVCGGTGNTAGSYCDTVVGGYYNVAGGYNSSVTGGQFVETDTDYSFAAGGSYTSNTHGPPQNTLRRAFVCLARFCYLCYNGGGGQHASPDLLFTLKGKRPC